MLVGETGTGKTYSVKTFLDAGITPFVLFTDPGMETLSEFAGPPTPDGCLIHWRYIAPASADWAAMIDSAKKINTLSHKALTEMGDINKSKYGQFIEVLSCLASPSCERCGKQFPPVDNWDTSMALILDNLTGLSDMAMKMVVGSKPVKSMANWGVAMDNLKNLVEKLSSNLDCFFVLIAHLEREHDEVTGAVKLMASTLGKKLAPVLPRTFSDVIEATREGTDFFWRTDSMSVATKARNVPLKGKIEPSYTIIVDSWKKKGAIS
jgi:hypothetical protein